MWAGAGVRSPQPSWVAQACCPCGRVVLGLLGACLATAAGSRGVWSASARPRTPRARILLPGASLCSCSELTVVCGVVG